jgi:hypothetical protein
MDAKIAARFDEIAEAAGGTVRCPICHKDEWSFGDDSVYGLDGLAIERYRRFDAEDAGEVPKETIPDDDFRQAFAILAVCKTCRFLRFHVVDLREM